MINDMLENLKGYNNLKNYVLDYYIDNNYEGIEELLKDMEDLQQYGCVSGMIGSLIYYDDTNKFFDNYKEEINDLLSDITTGTGLSVEELFGEKYDKEDPLNIDFSNKNLLAWFGFEETVSQLYEEIYEKVRNDELNFSY